MAQLSVDRKQRLRTLENSIRKAADQIQKNGLEIGQYLLEIRDDHLWKDDYESWNAYLKEMADKLVGKSWASSIKLIQAAEVEKRLPTRLNVESSGLEANHLSELSRLAPQKPKDDGRGMEKDYSNLKKQDIARVLKRAAEIADSETPSVRDVRKAVDIELGIDRTIKNEDPMPTGIDLPVYLRQKIGQIEGIIELLADVPADGWKLLEKSEPRLAERLATVCDELAGLLRS